MADKTKRLTVVFSSVTGGFEKGMKRARSGLAQFGMQLKRATISVVKWGAALTATAAAAVGFMVKRQLEALDVLAKTSDKLGVQTEQFQRLRFAASQSGVEVRTFDMGLQRFRRRLAEAAVGTGEAKDAIRQLGLDAKKLNELPLEEQMALLADAFGRVSNGGERLRLAFKLFDSEGVGMVNLLSKGRDGLKQFANEADRLGLTFSRANLSRIEAARDALDKLGKTVSAAAGDLAVNLSGGIVFLAETLTDVVASIRLMGNVAAPVFRFMESAALAVGRAFDTLTLNALKGFLQLGNMTRVMSASGIPGVAAGARAISNNPAFAISMDALELGINAIETGLMGAEVVVGGFAESMRKAINAIDGMADSASAAKGAGGFSIKDIAMSVAKDVAGAGIGVSGLASAQALGLDGGARFNASPAARIGEKIFGKVKQMADDIQAIRRNGRSGATGLTII